ncbi:MAG: addiction module protein [Bacteroidales bacterium]|nr:addiction module protein [Bacteroidales bacterium]
MNIQDIQTDKLSLITWITQLQDISLIRKLKNLQADNIDIPQWQKEEVNKRLKELEKNPGSAIDFDTMLDRLEEKYDL